MGMFVNLVLQSIRGGSLSEVQYYNISFKIYYFIEILFKNLSQILTVLSFISLAAAELTCESCRNIGKLLSEELASESSIQG